MTDTKSTQVSDRTFVTRVVVGFAAGFALFVGTALTMSSAHAEPDHGSEHVTPDKPAVVYQMPDHLPVCANEDGMVDGSPCIFMSDGVAYYVDSYEYRNDGNTDYLIK